MGLEEIDLPRESEEGLPEEVRAFLAGAEQRCGEFYGAGLGRRYYRYVPSDPQVVFRMLKYLRDAGDLRGRRFCELGCGFGIAAGMAAMLGFRACGIEIEEELADRAEQLMEEWELEVEILRESYLPEGFESCEGMGGKDLIRPPSGTSIDYEGIKASEVDLFFVYPWPDEEEFMRKLFGAVADEGAVLLMYQGEGEISAYVLDTKD
jgi:SAM-dependent methyltransferase